MSKRHVEFQITYTDRFSGRAQVHKYQGSDSGAAGWADALARDHGCKAVAEQVFNDGSRRHIVSHGDKP